MTTETSTATAPNANSTLPASGMFQHPPTIRSSDVARRVLVVEDDGILRGLIAEVFAFEGYFVTEADSEMTLLASVLRSAESNDDSFDLIVMGIQQRGSVSLDTLTRVRASGCQTPAIVLGNTASESHQTGMLELGASFLRKPFLMENLRVVANHVVSANRRHLEILD